jgi:multisubunit Na+/H+ antiporter MnhB subunit
MDQRRLRTLQVLFVLLVLFSIGAFLVGRSPPDVSIVGGFVLGGSSFIVAAGMLFLYWGWQSTVEP